MSAQEEIRPIQPADELAQAREREERAIDLMTSTIADHSRLLDDHEALKTELELYKVDELTGAFMRRAFLEESERLRQAVHSGTEENGYDTAVLSMSDLRKIHQTNNKHGQDEGDRVIGGYGHKLTELFHDDEPVIAIPGRLGGDEFAVLAAFNSQEITLERVEEIIHTRLSFWVASNARYGVRIGDLVISDPAKSMTDLFKEGDPKRPRSRSEKIGRMATNLYFGTLRNLQCKN